MSKRVVAVAIAVVGIVSWLVYSQQVRGPFKVSGFIEADEIRLGSRLGGRVAAVHVEEGQVVEIGELLVELEDYDLGHRLEEAEAQLAARQAELDRLTAGFRAEEIAQAEARAERLKQKLKALTDGPRPEEIEAARGRMQLAAAQLERARRSYDRIADLFSKETRAVTREDMDRATEELKVTEATRAVREQELFLLERGTREEDVAAANAELAEALESLKLFRNGARKEDIDAARAAVAAAKAAVAIVRTQRDELRVTSPAAGRIEVMELQPGDLMGAGAPVLSMLNLKDLWVRAYVPENRLGLPLRDRPRLAVGEPLEVTVDSFPGQRFSGRITYVARQAEFTPGNVQTPEERSKQVFRIKVTLDEGLDRLRPGMTADVWLP